MNRMSMSRFFGLLGAPLNNVMWSWGSQRSDGTVVLRQWETDVFIGDDGREYVVVAHNNQPAVGRGQNGWRERLRHIESMRSGARCLIVMLAAKDPSAPSKRIKTFDVHNVVVGGGLVTKNGMTCVPVADRRPISDFIKTSAL
jgi:putative restriction endonuclease